MGDRGAVCGDGGPSVADLVFVVLTAALFALLGLVVLAGERL
jgi:hypothetical protein